MADADRRARTRLDQPMAPRRGPLVSYDPESFGRTTETIARFLGTGRYLVIQSVVIVLWLVYNVAAPASWRFDPYTFTFLTLILSLQAAYAAPLILLAQNRQDDRDRINMDDDRAVAAQNKSEVEYLAREIAAIRIALGEVATRDFLRSELGRLTDVPRGKGEKKDRGGGGGGGRDGGGGGGGGKKDRPRDAAPVDPVTDGPTLDDDPLAAVRTDDDGRGRDRV